MKISLKKKQEKVEVENENGEIVQYTLSELTGSQRDRYLNFSLSKTKTDLDGNSSLRDVTGLYEQLLTLALTDEFGKNIAADIIKQWPSTAQSSLFKRAQELSGLAEEDEKDKLVIDSD